MPSTLSNIISTSLNHAIAFGSLTRIAILNILGAGGLLALKSVIESYNEERDLNRAFIPIYYTSLGLLSVWQLLELTAWSKNKYSHEKELVGISTTQQALARRHPVHFLFDEYKRIPNCLSCKKPLNHTQPEKESKNSENQATASELKV